MKRREITEPENTSEVVAKPGFKLSLLAVFLLSFAVLVFEVALTRVFSVMLTYHFVFAVVSTAMLGLGLGAMLFKRHGPRLGARAVWVGALVLSLALAGSLLLILVVPTGSTQLAGLRLILYLVLAVVPFGAAGFSVSGLFQMFPARSSVIYGADLIGAGAGALAVVPGMNGIGPINLVLLAAAGAGIAAALVGSRHIKRVVAAGGVAVLLAVSVIVLLGTGTAPTVPVPPDNHKDMAAVFADPAEQFRVSESRWSSFGRTDLVESPLYPNEKYLFVDGAAGSIMYDLDSILKDPAAQANMNSHSGESFPFQFLKDNEKRNALILGSGGGQDVVMAILGGVKEITAVEVNPDVVRFVQQYKGFSGGIYSGRPGVTAVVGEGRNFVRTSQKKYDLIMAAIPVTKSSRSVEGYALTENSLFTVEAFQDYLDHLSDSGRMILVAHNSQEIYRLVALALSAFAKQGLSETEAMNHIYAVGSEMMPTVVVQKQALSMADASAIHNGIHQSGLDRGVTFVPQVAQQLSATGAQGFSQLLAMFDSRLVLIAAGEPSVQVLSAATNADLRPTTDDRPFFYNFQRGLPGPFPLFLGLIIASVGALAFLLFLPPRRRGATRSGFFSELRGSGKLKRYLSLFFVLGMAYMVVEIATFQKLGLYISQPQLNLTILLSSLLLGGGVGSLLSSLLERRAAWVAAAIAALVAAFASIMSFGFPLAFGLGVDPKLTAFVLVFPLGVLMGFPFPIAMRSLAGAGYERHTAVMWGVNGATSVLGSALAMIVGITFGFSRALFVGAALYVLVAGLLLLAAKDREVPAAAERSSFTRPLPAVHRRSTPPAHTR